MSSRVWRVGRLGFLRDFVVRRILHRLGARVLASGYPVLAAIPSDSIGMAIAARGLYEEELLRPLFDRLLRGRREALRGTIALDVGANLGNHACFIARHVEHVLAFEPNPPVFKLLEANLALSGTHNVTAFALGLSDREALLEFRQDDGRNLGGSAFVRGEALEGAAARLRLPVVSADALLARQGERRPIGLIKLDVEGHEIFALRGMHELLARESAIVLFEALQARGEAAGNEVLGYLRSRGYRHFHVLVREWQLSPWVERVPKLRGLVELLAGLARGAHVAVQEVQTLGPVDYAMVIASKEPLSW